MLYVLIGIVLFALLSLLVAGHERVEKMKDNASKAQSGRQNTIHTQKYDGLQEIRDHEDHLDS